MAVNMCQNIKRSRAGVMPETINAYFDEICTAIKDVLPSNLVNYDDINLKDDPGKRKVITRRETKYPERVTNSSKRSTSVVFSVSAYGNILSPYVVYKAKHFYHSWKERGPENARYNRTESGWFDAFCLRIG